MNDIKCIGLNVQKKKYGNETDSFIAFKKRNTYTEKKLTYE